MSLIVKTLVDKDNRRLIYSFLKAGVMIGGFQETSEKGTPQCGVISRLLSNIYLNPFDIDLDKRGIKHVRYSDNIVFFAKSEMASRRIKANAINFLGFVFRTYGKQDKGIISKVAVCKVRKESWIKLKQNIRGATKRNRGVFLWNKL